MKKPPRRGFYLFCFYIPRQIYIVTFAQYGVMIRSKKTIERKLYNSLDPLYQSIIDVVMMTSDTLVIVENSQNKETVEAE